MNYTLTFLIVGAFLFALGEVFAYALLGTRITLSEERPARNADKSADNVLIKQEDPFELPKTPFEREYEKRISEIKEELETAQISKTPPPFFDYSESEYLKGLDGATEIITDEYEREYEKKMLHK